ncbi:phosphodiester glycosidase family protein [Paenibacillus koleovorans]|uniref:phosphodiester glycosidase family protein n=1 Tax=Paenibacillus koleovorans TaxID=121608 RepID=UPI001FEB40DB|nr:phosphodiester glycosidase family protein [Paenibacillus koleovorans]
MFSLSLFGVSLLFAAWFFFTASGTNLRYMMADTLITTQHRHWAKYLIGNEGLERQVSKYTKQFEEMSQVVSTIPVHIPSVTDLAVQEKKLIEIEPVSEGKFSGYIVSISDPKKIRLGVPGKIGKGEKVSSMVKRTGALLGVNAGGFVDPNWEGNGFQPTGIVISRGKVYYYDGDDSTPTNIVGIDKDGRMVAGRYTPKQMREMGIQEAVTFTPKFIVDGKGLVKNQADGWGIAPRTCMAQKEDGTIMFAIIDGRQTHSIGATLFDIQKLFLDRGAIIAANLDGGSSTVLVHNNEIVNKPASPHGERYLPTAFLVFDDPATADIKNIWEGLDISQIDPSKW